MLKPRHITVTKTLKSNYLFLTQRKAKTKGLTFVKKFNEIPIKANQSR